MAEIPQLGALEVKRRWVEGSPPAPEGLPGLGRQAPHIHAPEVPLQSTPCERWPQVGFLARVLVILVGAGRRPTWPRKNRSNPWPWR